MLDVILQARDPGYFTRSPTAAPAASAPPSARWGPHSERRSISSGHRSSTRGYRIPKSGYPKHKSDMVLAVPPEKWPALFELCRRENVEATDLGRFVDSGRLVLRYNGEMVADLSMDFLHEGRPGVVREAAWTAPEERPVEGPANADFTADLLAMLRHWDVCSKEWIIRQYDHEVQARTAVRPLVGESDDGPGDAAVIVPVRGSSRGLAVACGINPRYGKLDPYAMAGCAIDEAIRNCVAVGADPERIAFSTISAGATPSGPKPWARWCWPRRPATTWRWPTARLSFRERTA